MSITSDEHTKLTITPIRTTEWGSIKSPADYDAPTEADFASQELAHEPEFLNIDHLPSLAPDKRNQGAR